MDNNISKSKYLTLEDINSYESTSAVEGNSSIASYVSGSSLSEIDDALAEKPKTKRSREDKINDLASMNSSDGYAPDQTARTMEEWDSLTKNTDKIAEAKDSTYSVDETQSNWAKAGNSLVRTVVGELVGGTIESVGAVMDAGAKVTGINWLTNYILGTEDIAYNNFMTKGGKDLREWTNDNFQIYRENPGKAMDWGDFGYYAEHAPSVISSLTMMIPSMAVMKGASIAGTAAKAYGAAREGSKLAKMVGNAGKVLTNKVVQTGMAAVTSRSIENYREASQTYDTTYKFAYDRFAEMGDPEFNSYKISNSKVVDEAKDFFSKEDITKEELSQYIATRSADKTFSLNYGNLFWDILQFTAIGKLIDKGVDAARPLSSAAIRAHGTSIGMSEKAIKSAVVKGKTKEALLWLGASLPEAPEEMLNYISGKEGERYANQMLDGDPDATLAPYIPTSVLGSYINDEFWEAGIWGAIGSGVFAGGISATRKGGSSINKVLESKGKKPWFNIVDIDTEHRLQLEEINNRTATTDTYKANLTLIANGQNPFEVVQDAEGNPILDADGNPTHTIVVTSEDKHKLANQATKEYVREISRRAVRAGTVDYLKDYINTTTPNIAEDAETNAMLQDDLYNRVDASSKKSVLDKLAFNLVNLFNDKEYRDPRYQIADNGSNVDILKAIINDEIDQINKLYKQQYNNLLVEDSVHSSINDIIIENNIESILKQRDLQEDINEYEAKLDRYVDSNDNTYNPEFATNGGRETVNNLVTAVAYESLMQTREDLVAETDTKKIKALESHIKSLEKLLENRGIDPKSDTLQIDGKDATVEGLLGKIESKFNMNAEDAYNYAFQNIVKDLLNNNIVTTREGVIASAKEIEDAFMSNINSRESEAKSIIESAMKSAKTLGELNDIATSILDTKDYAPEGMSAEEFAKLASFIEGGNELNYIEYVSSIKRRNINRLKAESAAASAKVIAHEEEVKSTEEEAETPPSTGVVITADNMFDYYYYGSTTATVNVIYDTTSPIEIYVDHNTDVDLKITLDDTSNINKLNEYITSGAITVKPKINTITEDNALNYNYKSPTINIEVSLNEASNIQVTSDEVGLDFTLENVEAIDYLNNLILDGKLTVTPKPTFQGADNKGLTEAIDAVLSTGSTITADNLSNYTYTINSTISNIDIKNANTISIEEDEYSITLTLSNNDEESTYYTDEDALDYINDLIKKGKVTATLITDGDTLYSAMADIDVTNAVDEFIEASLTARHIKLNPKITPINLLDLLFHAKDVSGDIVKTIALRDKILSEFKTNEKLRRKYRINDIDIATVSSSSLYSIINKGRPEYIKYLSNKAIEENVTGVFNLDTSNLNSIFNENGTLSTTNRAVYEAVMNLKPKESKIVIRKDTDGKVYSYIQYKGTEVKLGSIPYVRVRDDGTVVSKVKGLDYIIDGDSIGIIDNLIKDINNMTTDKFVALYEALLAYKYSTEFLGGPDLDNNILNFINSNEVVNNFLYNRSDDSSNDRTMIKHLAEIFTFKDIRANVTIEGTGELNDVHNQLLKDTVVTSLGAWKSKVINNNNNYKVFNDMDANASVELEVEFVNKGFVNTSNKPVHIADAFSKDEIDNFALGQARIEDNATVIRFEGMKDSDRLSMNIQGLSPGASFLIYRDANGKPMRINTINAPFSPNHKYGDYEPSIRSAGDKVRKALQSDMEAMVADMLSSANMPNTNAANTDKLDDIRKYLLDVLIGQPMKNKNGDVVRNVGGLISGSSLLLIPTNKGFTISRRIGDKFVYLNFEYNDGRANMYYNYTDKGERKTGNITEKLLYRFFNLDSSNSKSYLQLNNDYIKLSNKSEYVLPRYSANSNDTPITFKSYKDYLISTGALMVKVAPVKSNNGKTVISGFIPTADMLGDGIRVGSPLSIKVKFPNVETTTPVGVAIKPIKETNEPTPVPTETSKTNVNDTIDKLDKMLSDGSITKVGDLILNVNPESRYSVLSKMLNKLNVTIHPKVLKVGESNDAFSSGEVPNAYAIYVRGTNTIYLTDKMKRLTNNDEIIRTVVHEAIHSIIHSNSYNTELLEDVYKAAEKSTDPTIQTYMTTFKAYGNNKLEEFLVEALTSVSFANALNNETSVLNSDATDTVEDKSLLQKLFDVVRDIIKKLQPSLLTDVNFIINKMESELANQATSLSIDDVNISTEETEQDNTTPTTEEDVTETINNTEAIGIDIQGAFDINNTDDSSFDEISYDDFPFSNIPDIKPISNMNAYRESLPDKLRSEFDKQVANGNITYICS